MPNNEDFIPNGNLEFFNWQENFMSKVGLNLVAWGILNADYTALQGFQTSYIPNYNKIKVKAAASPNDHIAHDSTKATYEKNIRQFVKQWIAGNKNISNEQANDIGVPKRDEVLTPRPAITTSPVAKASSEDGARILVVCRVEADSTKSSIHPDADGIEMVYIIGDTRPVNPGACTRTTFSTKARFYVTLDIADAGKKIYAFVRWKNTSDDSKSGPWCQMITVTITE